MMSIRALAWQHLKEIHLLYGLQDCWAYCSQLGMASRNGSTVVAIRNPGGVSFKTFPGLSA